MVLTIGFISENFHKFNKEYFNDELQTPSFEITRVKSYLGQYHWKYSFDGDLIENVIRISNMFDRSETDYQNTIIHEMIHLYIRQNHIKDTRRHHGRVFNSIADRINRQGGWHIARTDSIEGCGLTDKSSVQTYYIGCFYSGGSKKYFKFRINPKYLEYYKNKFDKYQKHYQDAFVFTSEDDKAYAHYSQCHSAVRGYYISKNEYDTLKETEKVVYSSQTLGLKHCAA